MHITTLSQDLHASWLTKGAMWDLIILVKLHFQKSWFSVQDLNQISLLVTSNKQTGIITYCLLPPYSKVQIINFQNLVLI